MANQWLRLWHDMPNDPKWRTIARVSKQPVSAVLAVYVHLLVIASNATERGRTKNVCSEDLASALDLETEQIDSILDAMQGRVMDGDMVSGWAKRQVEREDGSAERAKRWRDAQKVAKQTQANATERKQTPDTDTDTDKEKKTYAPPAGDAVSVSPIEEKPQHKPKAGVFDPRTAMTEKANLPEDLVDDFIAVRKAKRAPVTRTALNGIVAEAEKAGWYFEQAIRACVENNWQGFKADWVKDMPRPKVTSIDIKAIEAERHRIGLEEYGRREDAETIPVGMGAKDGLKVSL